MIAVKNINSAILFLLGVHNHLHISQYDIIKSNGVTLLDIL